jgi:hypothetical protein
MARAIAITVGALILAAAAHVTIQSTGGYGTSHSWLTMAVAGGVGVASVFSGMAWSEERRPIAVLLVLAIIAGEAYGLVATAERLIAGREAMQAPLRQISEDRAKAQRRVDDAIKAKTSLPSSSPRLERALADKAATDAAVVSKSAERGCVENCRKLLQAQADAAEQEVARAREEIAGKARDAEKAIGDARRDQEAMPKPVSAAPLADRLGWQPWVLDLVVAALGSLAANGLACFLVVYGAHRQKEQAHHARAQGPAHGAIEIKPTSMLSRTRASKRKNSARLLDDPLLQAKAFAVARLAPDNDASINIKDVLREYATWCRAGKAKQLPVETMASALDSLFGVEKDGKDYVVLGVSLKTIEGHSGKPIGALQ